MRSMPERISFHLEMNSSKYRLYKQNQIPSTNSDSENDISSRDCLTKASITK